MKIKRIFFTLTVLSMLLVHSGCEKRIIDFRNKYVGNYDLVYKTTWWQMNGESGSSVQSFPGNISYNKHNTGDSRKFTLKYNGTSTEFVVNKSGYIYVPNCITPCGKFESRKKFNIGNNPCYMGGLGGSGTISITGTRD